MLIDLTLLAIGIMILIIGSNYFVDGAASIAKNMKIPIMVIGLTIVAFGSCVRWRVWLSNWKCDWF